MRSTKDIITDIFNLIDELNDVRDIEEKEQNERLCYLQNEINSLKAEVENQRSKNIQIAEILLKN